MLGFCAKRGLFNDGFHRQRVANQIWYMKYWYNLKNLGKMNESLTP